MKWINIADGLLDYRTVNNIHYFVITEYTGDTNFLESLGFVKTHNEYVAPMTPFVALSLRNMKGSVPVIYTKRRTSIPVTDPELIKEPVEERTKTVYDSFKQLRKNTQKQKVSLKDKFVIKEEPVEIVEEIKEELTNPPLETSQPVSEPVLIKPEQRNILEEKTSENLAEEPQEPQEEIVQEEEQQNNLKIQVQTEQDTVFDKIHDKSEEAVSAYDPEEIVLEPELIEEEYIDYSNAQSSPYSFEYSIKKILKNQKVSEEDKKAIVGTIGNARNYAIKALLEDLIDPRHEFPRADLVNGYLEQSIFTGDTEFFTPKEVIKLIWNRLEAAGFNGGTILEPSAGMGNFISYMPKDIYKSSKIICIEKNPLYAEVLKVLHPKAQVFAKGFEDVNIKDNSLDLVITNVPFSSNKVFDPDYEEYKLTLHNYFIVKALDKLRPDGIGVFLTSRYTLDGLSSKAREEMAKRGILLGSFRLPPMFKGTESSLNVDVLIFRKTAELHLNQDFINTGKYEKEEFLEKYVYPYRGNFSDIANITHVICNDYYFKNKRLCAAMYKIAPYKGGVFDDKTAYVFNHGFIPDLETTIGSHLKNIDFTYTPSDELIDPIEDFRIEKYGLYLIDEYGRAYINNKDKTLLKKQALSADYIDLRDYLLSMLDFKNINEDARAELRLKYEMFKSKNGSLKKNAKYLENDPYYLSVLELDNPKTQIFEKDINGVEEPEHIDNVYEAVVFSMAKLTKIDMLLIQKKTGLSQDEIEKELIDKNIAYLTHKGWIIKNHYLSGDIYKKIDELEGLPEHHKLRNYKALLEVKPKEILFEDINFNIGSTWIYDHTDRINEFFKKKLFDSNMADIRYIRYDEVVHKYFFDRFPFIIKPIENVNLSLLRNEIGFGKLFLSILNNSKISFKLEEFDIKLEYDKAVKAVNDMYKEFLVENYREEVELAYNRTFNNIAPMKYDGTYLKLEGINSNISLRKNQLSAIERAVYEGTTLINHEVGTGKTYSLIAAAMEKKRLGQINKPMIITTNTVLSSFYQSAKELYPTGKILCVDSKMMNPQHKQSTLAKIAFNDWDLVLMSHSSFGLINCSKERQEELLKQEIDEYLDLINNDNDIVDSVVRKVLKSELGKKQAALDKFLKTKGADVGLTWENLSIDFLGVDEAHNFKNLGVSGYVSNSVKAQDLMLKLQYLYEQKGKIADVMFATGTPITNSVFEFYNIQRYLQKQLLEEKNIFNVNGWIDQFLAVRTEFEPNASATSWIERKRFKFKNIPELIQMVGYNMDIATADQIGIKIPEEKRITVICEQSEIQRYLMAELDKRVKAIMDKNNPVDPREDNLLKIVSEGSLNSLEPRLLNPDFPDFLGGKTSRCAETVYRKYKESDEIKGTQLIFCDLGTPKGSNGYVYRTITNKLVELGIPENEIEWIHNHKSKDALFKKVRSGEVRVLIGSTQKMGEGMNVQDRCVAIHHLDVPWRPSDVEQREGRAVRFGNANDQVEIYVYATEKSFDSFRWNTIDYKFNEVVPIARGTFDKREQQYDFDCAATFDPADLASITATDPRLKQKFKLEKKINEIAVLTDIESKKRYNQKIMLEQYAASYDANNRFYNKVKDFKMDQSKGWVLVYMKKGEELTFETFESNQVTGRLITMKKNIFINNKDITDYDYNKLWYQGKRVTIHFRKFSDLFFTVEGIKREFHSLKGIEKAFSDIYVTVESHDITQTKLKNTISEIQKDLETTTVKEEAYKKELQELDLERDKLMQEIMMSAKSVQATEDVELDYSKLEDESMYSYKETHYQQKFIEQKDDEEDIGALEMT